MRADTNARRREIRSLLTTGRVRSQRALQVELVQMGFDVTQATISRDLAAIGARRVKENGGYRYRLVRNRNADTAAADALHEAVDEFVETLVSSGNLIVMKVPPGAAQFVASRIDAAPVEGVLGTIAGDDTILVVADEQIDTTEIARSLSGTE
ncbi:MAG: arginine repressor [Acidimicrobiia bacterium]|nr:MAG: arginine repressor [Acidimicrobiia bacterium]